MKFGDVEVLYIEPKIKCFGLLIHHRECEGSINSPKTKLILARKVDWTKKFLVNQGFLPSNLLGWKYSVAGLLES